MKVSVSITAYNHAQFIAQAIESVLRQETSFDYEILIGEDESEDATRAIVRNYQRCYPERIRLFLNTRQDVVWVDGRPTGRWNLANNLRHARGEYVALLDGDDAWLGTDKLQRQVDHLDQNPESSACFHAVRRISADSEVPETIMRPPHIRESYGVRDLLEQNFIPTGSVVFRRGLFGELPPWFFETPTGDRPLLLLNAQYGPIDYIDEVMGIYRVHGGGVWSGLDREGTLRSLIRSHDFYRRHLPRRFRLKALGEQAKLDYRLFRLTARDRGAENAAGKPARVWLGHLLLREMSSLRLARMLVGGRLPRLSRAIRRLRAPFQ